MALRFLHAADLHLGSPLSGLAARDARLAALFERASWRAFEALVALAIDEAVPFVLISGDVFDRDWKDWSTGQAFVREIARLSRAGIRTVLIRGNHDAESVISRSLPLPEGAIWLGADRPETIDWPDLNVAVHGMSFKTAAVTEALVHRYPAPLAGRINVGMLHTSLDGRPDVSAYAPCQVSDLVRAGYDYWALGHVHVRETVREAAPAIVFPGNLQGRSIRETGPKGAALVTLDGGRVTIDHRALDAARWALVTIDATGTANREALLAGARTQFAAALVDADGRPLAVRIRITGETALAGRLAADREALREELQATAAAVSDAIAVEKVVVAARPPSAGLPLAIADLDEALGAVMADAGLLADLDRDRELVQARMPAAAAPLLDPDPEAVLAAARALVLAHLGGAG